MPDKKDILLLSGSPKVVKSSSEALGTYLLDKLRDRGWNTAMLRLYQAAKSPEQQEELLSALLKANVIVLSSPLYVDSLPAAVLQNLEYINTQKAWIKGKEAKGFLAIVNCGFPEAEQNYTALEICRLFALKTGFSWLGGLPVGMGGVIGGRSLDAVGGVARNIKRALDFTAEALEQGREIPGEVLDLLRKPPIPVWMYRMAANFGMKGEAKKNGVSGRIKDRPYEL